jgi:DNA-binding Xre family transcriptional regulator
MLAKQVGANIKAARKAKAGGKGWSLQKVAAKIEPKPTTYQHLARLEAGKALTLEWVEKIAKALGVDPIDLIAGPRKPTETLPQLSEQVASEVVARTLAVVALKDPDPDENTVQDIALALRGMLQTFAKHPEAATDASLAQIAADAVGSRYGPAAS